MVENKTKPTKDSVAVFLNKIEDQQVRDDCFEIIEMMGKVSNLNPSCGEAQSSVLEHITMFMRAGEKEIQ